MAKKATSPAAKVVREILDEQIAKKLVWDD
jgi:hypothetical protein